MKILFFIPLFCLISTLSQSQDSLQYLFDEIDIEIQQDLNKTPKSILYGVNLLPGDHLIKGGNYMLVGTSISVVGNLVGIIAATEFTEGYLVGFGSGIVGSIIVIVGIVHIIKSGQTHNQYERNSISLRLQPTQNGLGLCLKL